ncbi:hypothetical protein [Weissella confusa]|uniref:hypothetical protein n=1 Tax=Weissella confusa TaxID=1583 RepID=UPI000704E9C0|nr:hypothetical protein [Weissella confusa]KRN21844.1 hypothetical protein IV69_GL000593 [Weissella confusa]MBJ7629312.1 hypothetical protein [Weissella confusa]MBJ7699714.1 hypothetical protein [Weissella confusa]MBS7551847.1 hypothetical protein [Weissella confusa]MCQ8097714.1 hypothetical protein [Weissella confusa]
MYFEVNLEPGQSLDYSRRTLGAFAPTVREGKTLVDLATLIPADVVSGEEHRAAEAMVYSLKETVTGLEKSAVQSKNIAFAVTGTLIAVTVAGGGYLLYRVKKEKKLNLQLKKMVRKLQGTISKQQQVIDQQSQEIDELNEKLEYYRELSKERQLTADEFKEYLVVQQAWAAA